jgi:hypothetical protein
MLSSGPLTRRKSNHRRGTARKYLAQRGGENQTVLPFQGQGGQKGHQQATIVRTFLEILTAIRLYHWSTTSYAQHKTTDELYKQLETNIDRFVEVVNGKNVYTKKGTDHPEKTRVRMVAAKMRLYDFKTVNQLSDALFEFREFLVSLSDVFREKGDVDVLTIRDEMVAIVNQYLYLLTMA